MDKRVPTPPTPATYMDIENRVIDKYLPHIGVYGLVVYTLVKWQLSQEAPHRYPSYAAIARKMGMDQQFPLPAGSSCTSDVGTWRVGLFDEPVCRF